MPETLAPLVITRLRFPIEPGSVDNLRWYCNSHDLNVTFEVKSGWLWDTVYAEITCSPTRAHGAAMQKIKEQLS